MTDLATKLAARGNRSQARSFQCFDGRGAGRKTLIHMVGPKLQYNCCPKPYSALLGWARVPRTRLPASRHRSNSPPDDELRLKRRIAPPHVFEKKRIKIKVPFSSAHRSRARGRDIFDPPTMMGHNSSNLNPGLFVPRSFRVLHSPHSLNSLRRLSITPSYYQQILKLAKRHRTVRGVIHADTLT